MSYNQLTKYERYQIKALMKAGLTQKAIAEILIEAHLPSVDNSSAIAG